MTGSTQSTWSSLVQGPIVVGVDDSPNAGAAASFARTLARKVGAECKFVHVAEPGRDAVASGQRVREALGKIHPPLGLDDLDVMVGPAPEKLVERAVALNAALIIVGGKHHSLLGRWMAGSTAVGVARISPIPVLVTRGAVGIITHVLAGADATPAAFGAIRAAEEWSDLWLADLRVVHAVPLPPVLPEYGGGYEFDQMRAAGEARAAEAIWPLIGRARTERVVEVGSGTQVLTEQTRYWQAELLVVARHDRGWVERAMLGSVTEQLLDALPTSLLVVPATRIAPPKDVTAKVSQEVAQ
ncbi:MAG TPA: universal stress protein [Gemmatimonadales bacterium]|nr:universal stress protein [Gemmatimonadales bacterium]